MSDDARLLAAALRYAGAGVNVFPLNGKAPMTKHGFHDASHDRAQVEAWWTAHPDAGIGCPDFDAVDVDLYKPECAPTWERIRPLIPEGTPHNKTGGGGLQFLFAAGTLKDGKIGPGVDSRYAGRNYIVLPPSPHRSGGRYETIIDLLTHKPKPAPDFPQVSGTNSEFKHLLNQMDAGAKITDGRNKAAWWRAVEILRTLPANTDLAAVQPLVQSWVDANCGGNLSEVDVAKQVRGAARFVQAERAGEATAALEPPAYEGDPRPLGDVVATFQRHLHMPDPASLLLTLATIVANMMEEGDPVWLVNIGGSSRGKTEVVAALDGFPGVRVVGALTVAALLSGTARKDRAKSATGGILNELGDRGVLVVKDFGALLTLHRDARAQVLQALRDIYDGLYTRDVGVDGGTKLRWQGRLGLIAGATSALDSAHGVLSALGERWVTIRLPDGGEKEMVRVALADTDTRAARDELRDAVHGFLSTLEAVPLRPVTADELELFSALAPLVVLARSPVERDSYKRDIVHVHSPEGPARIVRQLHKLLVSLEAMGVDQPAGLILRAGLDSIPSPRRDVLVHLLRHGEQSTTDVATALGFAATNTTRACEDLAAHRLLTRSKAGDAATSANLWTPVDRIVEYWQTLDRFQPETA